MSNTTLTFEAIVEAKIEEMQAEAIRKLEELGFSKGCASEHISFEDFEKIDDVLWNLFVEAKHLIFKHLDWDTAKEKSDELWADYTATKEQLFHAVKL